MSDLGNKEASNELTLRFVSSMKIIFDILDDDRTGYVMLSDLDRWWQADGSDYGMPGLSSEVLNALRKVALPNGRLSFDRFIAAMKLSLLRGNLSYRKENFYNTEADKSATVTRHGYRSDSDQDLRKSRSAEETRTSSTSRLSDLASSGDARNDSRSSNSSKSEKQDTLNNGYVRHNEMVGSSGNDVLHESRRQKKSQERGEESKQQDQHHVIRRHTLTNGVDHNFIQRMKLMQQEKEMLQQGLDVVESGRHWYLRRLKELQLKQKNFEKNSLPSDYSVETNMERIWLEKLRISSVNQQLQALMDNSGKGFPLHMNLAISQSPGPSSFHSNSKDVEKLKMHNMILTQDLGRKTELIAKLEKEKIILVREMFQARTSNRGHALEEMTLI